MTDTLQQAAAAPAVDPNTMLAAAPNTSTAAAATTSSPALEQETFVDEWAKAPDEAPPVRTWRDPTKRGTPAGDFEDAWYDTPAAETPKPPNAADNAAEIAKLTAAPAPAATPATDASQYRLHYTAHSGGEGGSNMPMYTLTNADGSQHFQLSPEHQNKLNGFGGFQSGGLYSGEQLKTMAGWEKPAETTTTT
jgi:hypothetical protein